MSQFDVGVPDAAQGKRVVELVPTKSDEALAAEFKAQLRAAGEQVCAVMTAARASGLILSWQAAWDQAGRAYVQSVDVMKPL